MQVNTTAIQAKAQAAGLDWSKLGDLIRNMNWLEVIQFVQTIISLFRSGPQPLMARAGGTGHTPGDAAVAHFEAIEAIAACGKECCASGGA